MNKTVLAFCFSLLGAAPAFGQVPFPKFSEDFRANEGLVLHSQDRFARRKSFESCKDCRKLVNDGAHCTGGDETEQRIERVQAMKLSARGFETSPFGDKPVEISLWSGLDSIPLEHVFKSNLAHIKS